MAGGADIQVVKELLGHGSITTQTYLHTLSGADAAALAALAALDPVRSARNPALDPSEAAAAASAGGSRRDDELAQMRRMLAEMKQMLVRSADTA